MIAMCSLGLTPWVPAASATTLGCSASRSVGRVHDDERDRNIGESYAAQ